MACSFRQPYVDPEALAWTQKAPPAHQHRTAIDTDRDTGLRVRESCTAQTKKAPRPCDLGAESTKGEVEETIGAHLRGMLEKEYSHLVLQCSNQLWLCTQH